MKLNQYIEKASAFSAPSPEPGKLPNVDRSAQSSNAFEFARRAAARPAPEPVKQMTQIIPVAS